MLLEKLFGNLFGLIWLLVFIGAIIFLIVWLFIKRDFVEKKEDVVKKELLRENYGGFLICENEEGKYELKKENGILIKVFDSLEDAKVFVDVLLLRNENDSVYEIVEIGGFFKVRKKGSERTLRKFETEEEAENYVKEKGNNDWSKVDR